MKRPILAAAAALALAGPARAGDGTFTHIGSPIDRIDISGYLQACSNTPNVPEQDKVAHFNDAGGMEYNFSWKCSAGRLFMTDGEFGYEFKCDGSAGGCHGATWRQITPPNAPSPPQEPPAPRAPAAAAVPLPNPLSALFATPPPAQASPAARLPGEALKAYCAVARILCRRSSATDEPVRLSCGGASRARSTRAQPEPTA